MTRHISGLRTPSASLEAAVGYTNLDRELDAYARRVSAAVNANLNDHAVLKETEKFRTNNSARRLIAPVS